MRNPYTQQLNVGIERALTSKTSLTVSYIMNRGKRLFTVRDLNIGPLSSQVYNFTILDSNYNPTGQVYSTPIYLASNRIDSRYGHINQVENGPFSESYKQETTGVRPPDGIRPLPPGSDPGPGINRDQGIKGLITAMDNAGGFLLTDGTAPVWIGEFGTGNDSLAAVGASSVIGASSPSDGKLGAG